MDSNRENLIQDIYVELVQIISESNGINLPDTLELLLEGPRFDKKIKLKKTVEEFQILLASYQNDQVAIDTLLNHPVAEGLFEFFKRFPIPYREEHIHLTGSLGAEFVYPRIKKLLEGHDKAIYEEKIREIYGDSASFL